jgi:hypothetical protein
MGISVGRGLVRGTIAVTLGLGAVVGLAGPAAAHDRQENLLTDFPLAIKRGHGGVNQNHSHVWVCDDRSDGLGVELHYRLYNGVEGVISDTNGSQPGCGGGFPTSSEVKEFRISAGSYTTPYYQS